MNTIIQQLHNLPENESSQSTAQEIERQPQSWQETWQKIQQEHSALENFCSVISKHEQMNIVLTGAGSSAFVGETAANTWQQCFDRPARAIPTTDLVTHFEDYILTDRPLLLISFARSGNSPESTAAVERANQYCSDVYHLIITCNPNGQLASFDDDNTYVFTLPPGAEDKGLAMTNSFTSMLLAVTAIPKLLTGNRDELDGMIHTMSCYAEKIFNEFTQQLHKTATADFNRIVFLGSGPNWGIAKESHLKVQELTNGEVIGKYDSFLGFRHGPKAVINDDTLLVYLNSNRAAVQPYEQDLIEQVNAHKMDLTTLAIAEDAQKTPNTDYAVTLNEAAQLDENLWAIVCTLPAQIIGFYKSMQLGYNPDAPSPDGTIARVVEGVTIYPNA